MGTPEKQHQELKESIDKLSGVFVALDKKIDVFIQEQKGEAAIVKDYMVRNDASVKKLDDAVHELQLWKVAANSDREDLKEVKKVIVRWIAGGLVASAAGAFAVLMAVFKVGG